MSLNSLANAAVTNRLLESSRVLIAQIPGTVPTLGTAPVPGTAPVAGTGPVPGVVLPSSEDYLGKLARLIPGEVLALYASVCTAIETGSAAEKVTIASWVAFGVCLLFTPLCVWMMVATKLKRAGQSLPLKITQWPIWEMCCGSIAFVAWAIGMPRSPFRAFTAIYSGGVAALVIPATTLFLGLTTSLFEAKPENTQSP